ncbi:MAG: 1-deoxy-D-xylulose-5-phosphate synthase [Gemmatimonadaceae bacterium]|nr:1-deoxy-D-xylulose-5-phosphate synthase [Gemmatimonadaceae bacterium]
MSSSPLLDTIASPADLKGLSVHQLQELADEMRASLIETCSSTGGHIGAGLGVVELTVALHFAFDTPRDQLVWDVGHQGYPHKLLTGRASRMATLRQEGGLSGFLKRAESEYDSFGAGHAATSISAAYGMAVARDMDGADYKVVAIIGDGSLGSGLAYEGLNNAGASRRDMIVVLNDNEMSIAPNVGAMHKYLTSVQRNSLYNRIRQKIGDLARQAPWPLKDAERLIHKWEESLKGFLTPGVLFEELGFRYFGPIDGHDIGQMAETFKAMREMKGTMLVHVITQKGKGFPAGENTEKWHALPPGHDPGTGKLRKPSTGNANYTTVFGKGLAELMDEDRRLAVITAAMPSGTGASAVASALPDRFFDVGIAEAHAVTMAAGMAARGARPFVAVYSTFMQRAYDSIIHDVAIQHLPVVLCLDRAGLVGEDGETHAGLYDIAYLLAVPNVTVTAPKDGRELLALMRSAAAHDGAFAIRYPRDAAPDTVPAMKEVAAVPYGTWEVLRTGGEVAILAVGAMVVPSLQAAESLAAEGLGVSVVNCRFLKPYDATVLSEVVASHGQVLVVEEGTVVNGFGAMMARVIGALNASVRVATLGVPDRIVYAASRARQLEQCGLDAAGIAASVRSLYGSEAMTG